MTLCTTKHNQDYITGFRLCGLATVFSICLYEFAFMNKLIVITCCLLLSVDVSAQQRIDCLIRPSFDAPATVQIQPTTQDRLLIIFKQVGKESRPKTYSTWGDDTTKLVEVRRMGRYFQQFAFSDTVTFTQQEAPFIYRAYQEVLSHADTLATSKDDRLLLDGLQCTMTVYSSSSKVHQLEYSTPSYESNKLVNQLLQTLLRGLKMKSKNPATVNYCMVADVYMN